MENYLFLTMFNELGYNAELVFRNMPEPTGFLRTTFPINRVLPDIFLAGAQKSGTTSLYSLLIQHPSVAEPQLKEPFYFGNDDRFPEFRTKYRSNFPPAIKMNYLKRRTSASLTIDATTNYFDHPLAAMRIKEIIPHAKIILLLRNPVARAFSHYKMAVRNGLESLDFRTALSKENERILSGENRKHNYCRQRLGYRIRGEYSSMIQPWIKTFHEKQLLIIRAEDFFSDPAKVFQRVLNFLALPPFTPSKFTIENEDKSELRLDDGVRKELEMHYRTYNEELESITGLKFNWNQT